MEQSANPVARVGHYTRTVSANTQNASILVTDSCSVECVFFVRCVQIRLLTYLLMVRHILSSAVLIQLLTTYVHPCSLLEKWSDSVHATN